MVGLASYLIESFYFYKKDIESGYVKDVNKYRDQQFQVFIYNINQSFVRTNEPSFTNLTIFDRPYIYGLFADKQYADGTYITDYTEEIIQFQKEFMNIVSETRKINMFTFPVLTYSLLYQDNKFVDEDFARWCNNHNLNWYDSNFYLGKDITVLSSCCRLSNNMNEVNKNNTKLQGYVNSIGGSSISIGSIKVNTINMMRIAIESNKSKEKFMEILKERTFDCIKILDVQRSIIKRNIEKGLLPMYTYGLKELNNQFSTIGITALANAIEYMGFIQKDKFNYESWTDEGIDFNIEILENINKWKEEFICDYSINMEMIPAEQAGVKLCTKDKLLYPDDINDYIYANQFIALKSNTTVDERIKLSAIFDNHFGGGNILHINVENKIDEDKSWELLNYIAKQGVVYFAFTTKINVDENKHSFIDEICPICGKLPSEQYQRIVGLNISPIV